MLEAAHGETEQVKDWPHPHRVAPGQVVVDGYDVDTVAGERVEIRRQRCHQGFAFAGLHLGDFALVQDGAADELDVVVSLAQRAARGLAHHGERFREEIVQRRAIVQPAAELVGLSAELFVGQGPHGIFQAVDPRHQLAAQFFGGPFRRIADYLFQQCNHRNPSPVPSFGGRRNPMPV